MEEVLKQSSSPRIPAYVLAGAALVIAACSAETTGVSENDVGQQSSAARRFCGNGRCDHGETCSTCSQDCGACPDAGGSDAGGSDAGGSDAGGSDASSGTNPCGSTAAPPAN